MNIQKNFENFSVDFVTVDFPFVENGNIFY